MTDGPVGVGKAGAGRPRVGVLAAEDPGDQTKIVILETGSITASVIVDVLDEVLTVDDTHIERAPTSRRYFSGAKEHEGSIVLGRGSTAVVVPQGRHRPRALGCWVGLSAAADSLPPGPIAGWPDVVPSGEPDSGHGVRGR